MNAKEIATQIHAGQFRRDGVTPEITHQESVASFFEEDSLEWDLSWLHDVWEANPHWSYETLEEKIGSLWAFYVAQLTIEKGQSYKDYIENLSGVARKVKIADIFSNLAESPTEYQKQKYRKALKILLANL